MKWICLNLLLFLSTIILSSGCANIGKEKLLKKEYEKGDLLNTKANGFKGIWYSNQPSHDEYVFKYSGGYAVYPAKHKPFAIYRKQVDKTFFCFGGTDDRNSTLYHNVSYFDHTTGELANPTILLDKKTTDAHDNPVMSMDKEGYLWIFSTAHGTGRPSFISKSISPYSIEKFKLIEATEIENGKKVPFNNFSYFQVWYDNEKGFIAMFTKYQTGKRLIGFNTSINGIEWKKWKVIAKIQEGHYAIGNYTNGKLGVAFNFHPNIKKYGLKSNGLNNRTNLYYVETSDFGHSWQNVSGKGLNLPLTKINNDALVHNYFTPEKKNVYLKDINFKSDKTPVLSVIISRGYESGPKNDPRQWVVFDYENGWKSNKITTSDHNYDMGEMYIISDNEWKMLAPTERGTFSYNPGGEMALWKTKNRGKSWVKKVLTTESAGNHTYSRKPLNPNNGFYAIWADGNPRVKSKSNLYFSDNEGNIYRMPYEFEEKFAKPIPL